MAMPRNPNAGAAHKEDGTGKGRWLDAPRPMEPRVGRNSSCVERVAAD